MQVPLTKLHNQDVMEGWLPLMPKAKMMAANGGGGVGAAAGSGGLDSSSLGAGGGASLLFGHRVTGSIRVRVQWVHSLPALVAYRLRLNREVKHNRDQVLATRRQALRSLRDAAKAMTRKRRAQRAQRRPSIMRGRGGSIDLRKHYPFLRSGGAGRGNPGGSHNNRLDRLGSTDSDVERHDSGWSGGDSGSDTTTSRNGNGGGGGPYRTMRYGSGGSGSALGGASNHGGGGASGKRGGVGSGNGGGNGVGAVFGQVGAGMGYGSNGANNGAACDASSGRARRRSTAAFRASPPNHLARDFPGALQGDAMAAGDAGERIAAPLSEERRGFLKGVYRSFSRVMSAGGVLSVRPLQGLNLPHPRSHDQALYAKVLAGVEACGWA